MFAVVSAVFAGCAVWVKLPSSPAKRLSADPPRESVEHLITAGVWAPAFLLNLLVFVLARPLVIWTVLLTIISLLVAWLLARQRHRVVQQRMADEVTYACNLLAGQLKVGAIPASALTAAARHSSLLASVSLTQQVGGDVAEALERLAEKPGAKAFRELASAWRLCENNGASLAPALIRVVENLRATRSTNRTITTELSSARITGRMLLLLPVMGVGLGFIAGGNPVEFLTGTWLGQLCLLAATLLAAAGLVWIEKLADSTEKWVA